MNALLKGLLARGYTIEKEGRYHSNATVIHGYGHEFGFRAKEAARLAAAKKRRELALFKRARLWKRCGDLREFVEAVRQLTEERPLPEGAKQEAAEWIEWATGVADAYDPLATWAEKLPERVQKPR